ncbi:hypothetical protein BG74_01730 [Sodalis-like endosymbiont of Proechinophthirus fluctus]|uniref:metallophosphoesterase family protein n=1 Tax=Sodalis-like endosymbiont of Proechinophthirus fluctus TaxID=1462730 RepID=UPI0007A7EB0D|nr:hypothetical protein BG74_01730 [Sodalis-like endosymbiont of Proechinophthirus fluctus]
MVIAQISDIHVADDNDNLSRQDRALACLDIIAPDVLVLTGDLIDNSEIEGYTAIAARLTTYPSASYWGILIIGQAIHTVLNAFYCTDGKNAPLPFVEDFRELCLHPA